MSWVKAHIRDWVPAAASICAVLLTAAYAVTKESSAADRIRDVGDLASTLTDAAKAAEKSARSSEEIAELKRKRTYLEQRMEDSRKPGCVVAELTEAARKTGLTVREIQPFSNNSRAVGQPDQHKDYPQYRIQVRGTYVQIAEYMDRCSSQRIPARVKEFRIGRTAGRELVEGPELTAELVVEGFQPSEPEKAVNKDN
jgi:hypothetical protein